MKRRLYFINFATARAFDYTFEDVIRLYGQRVSLQDGTTAQRYFAGDDGLLYQRDEMGAVELYPCQYRDTVLTLVEWAAVTCFESYVFFTPYLDVAIKAVMFDDCRPLGVPKPKAREKEKIIGELMALHAAISGGKHFGMLSAERAETVYHEVDNYESNGGDVFEVQLSEKNGWFTAELVINGHEQRHTFENETDAREVIDYWRGAYFKN